MSIRRKILAITLMVIVGGLAGLPARLADYDLVILNGRVMDPETKLDAVRNVGVRDGKIAAVTQKIAIKGTETIDATPRGRAGLSIRASPQSSGSAVRTGSWLCATA